MNDQAALQVAVQAARAGGRVALDRLDDPGYVRWKGQRDVVTASSLAVQDAILEVIRGGRAASFSDVLKDQYRYSLTRGDPDV